MVFHRDTPFLRPAIASVLDQTMRDFELVLVDNGTGLSADDLGAIGRDARLRWVRLGTNEGIARGHNAGVAAARADIIALLDHDDMMLPDRLACQNQFLRAHPELGLVGSGAAVIDASGRRVGKEFCLIDRASHRIYSNYFAGAIMPSFTGRTEVFRKFAYRPALQWAADFDFVTRVAESHAIEAVPRILLHYRRHPAQATVERRAAQVREECYVRLLTARRRRGASEDFGSIARELQDSSSPEIEHAVHREFSDRFLAERFPSQAGYQARRLVVTGGNLRSFARALRVLGSSVRQEPARAFFFSRLFLQGPVHALGLRNAGPLLNE
jgi:glycosyltransferase involved in cell wall biosynthesis